MKEHQEESIRRIDELLKKKLIDPKNAKISFVNSYVSTSDLDENWKQTYASQNFEGGFYLDRAIKKTLVQAYQQKTNSFPILVVVTGNIHQAILDKSYADLKFTYPEDDYFYKLGYEGNLEAHSLIYKPDYEADTIQANLSPKVLAYPNAENPIAFLPDNQEGSIGLKKDTFKLNSENIQAKNWQSALQIHGKWLTQNIHPETAGKEWVNLVRYSFLARIMNQFTSYIVVENEAQKAILKKKQKQVLNGHHSLNLSEDTQRMSEPSLILVLILFGIFLKIRQRKKLVTK